MRTKSLFSKIAFGVLCVFCAAIIAGNVVCFNVLGVDFITSAISGTGATYGDSTSAELGAELVKKVSEEGTVLLKNENDTLPLDLTKNNKVNVFGYTALDNAWVFTGVGSGSCKPDPEKRVGILQGLTNAGFEYNADLIHAYKEAIPSNDAWMSMNQNGKILQPDNSFYSDERMQAARNFSDTAIVVLSRNSGENVGEVPTVSVDYLTGKTDESRSYLDLSAKEEYMLEKVTSTFEKVIVILNTSNNMQCGFLTDEGIDAALYCGPTGLCGAESVANLIAGKKTVKTEEGEEEVLISPSGRLADTYAYDYGSEPGFANYAVRNKSATGGNIVYQEDIYFGYRWYETAAEEGFIKDYYDAVIYPFGYGLSYTTFDWTLKKVSVPNGSKIEKDTEFELTVTVENTGDYPGQDVVELYFRTPYTPGGIEKSSITLGDFAKTSVLRPGESQDVTLTLTAYDMASYDCYDKNGNENTGYELDGGNYTLELKTDVHTLKDMKSATLSYSVDKTILFSEDPVTGYDVINRFTGDEAYAGVSIDGSNVGLKEKYLTREDFYGSFRDRQSPLPEDTDKVVKGRLYASGANNTDEMPVFGADNGLYIITKADGTKASAEELKDAEGLVFNDELVDRLTADYDGALWDQLVDQMTKKEVRDLVEKSGFGSAAIESIGKVETLDFDGPSGFNENTQKPAEDKSAWTSYPAECLVGCSWSEAISNEIGQSVAYEASKSGISGWYAPGVNLHRSNYNGRNYEYYSEDPVISGKLAAATIMGAKSGGLYCYLKHFALSEEGDNAKGVDTWITEQNFREIYLKPFEIAVKAGANAIMTAFNRIGPVWAGANYDLLTEVLRKEWGFVGSVVTDWSSGDEIMNTPRGVRAGNDLWLNPMAQNYTPLDENDATEMYCAKLAAKNNLYTYVSTYKYARDFDNADNPYQVVAGVRTAGDADYWWIWLLGAIDAVFFAGTLALGLYLFVPWDKIRGKRQNASDAE